MKSEQEAREAQGTREAQPGPFKRVLLPGFGDRGKVFVFVTWDGKRLSLTGVEGPMPSGNAWGGCGQVVGALGTLQEVFPRWTPEQVAELARVWERWHLNDMRAGCAHQREAWDTREVVEVVSYRLTYAAQRLRTKAREALADAALKGETLELSAEAKALAGLDKWFQRVFAAPDADGPLSGCYEVEKRETKSVGWVRPEEHSRGLLGKACPECGYQYGHGWLVEEVPEVVLVWLAGLPEEAGAPAGWGRW